MKNLIVKSLSTGGLKLLGAVSIFLLTALITNSISTEEAGYFLLGFTLINLFSGFCRLGYDGVLVKHLAAKASYSSQLFQYTTIKSLLLSTLIALALFIFSPHICETIFSKPEFEGVFKAVALSIPFYTLNLITSFAFLGKSKYKTHVFFMNISVPFGALIFILFTSPTEAVTSFQGILLSSIFSAFLALTLWYKTQGVRLKRLQKNIRKKISRTAYNMYLTQICSLSIVWGGQIFLGIFGNSSDVAIFTTAQRTSMLISILFITINTVITPTLSTQFSSKNFSALKETVQSSSKLLFGLSVPILALIVFFPKNILSIFGSGYSEASLSLVILALGQFVNVSTGSVNALLAISGNEKYTRNNMLVSTSIVVFGSIFIAPIFGVLGVSIVTAIAVATQNLLGVWQVKEIFGFNSLAFLAK